jgi:5-methyltetrahydropteroyltriglutamate--homocysteine methyltransferase
MSIQTHILGYPRIGAKRELKFAEESYWKGEITQTEFIEKAQAVEAQNWQAQIDAGLSLLSVGDFIFYDSILTHAVRLGAIPERFSDSIKLNYIDQQFYLARGRAPNCTDVAALEMTKWFDTNYHYLVPELNSAQKLKADFSDLFDQIERAQKLNHPLKVVIPGLVTFLYLSKMVNTPSHPTKVQGCECHSEQTKISADQTTLTFIDQLLPIYATLFDELKARGVEYVQIDEAALVLDLSSEWQAAFEHVYHVLQRKDGLKLIISTYFESLGSNLNLAVNLPVAGLHIDITREKPGECFWKNVIDQLPSHKILSLGLINGRSVWASDLVRLNDIVQSAQQHLGDRLWLSTSCSLLHVPVDLSSEHIPPEIDGKLAFARQKLDELVALASGHVTKNNKLSEAKPTTFNLVGQERTDHFETRFKAQQEKFKLPLLPTTTIGSFPQTAEIRAARAAWNNGHISNADYETAMKKEIAYAIQQQEELGLDVLVHGEAERTDMVEYFAGLLSGFWLSKYGWVQSYGSRCVRPPIIVDDITRPHAMTVKWIKYANTLSDKIVKGMLTGPVTILNWSFPPAHRTRAEVCLQLAEAIRQEVADLQNAGIEIIQIDEAAFREGLPLRQADQPAYWDWAVKSFKHCSSSAKVDTQIHTHMCYSDFKDCLAEITAMDADVITIETSRSGLQLLEIFHEQGYPNAIGPGVYDIHSPQTPSLESMRAVIQSALKTIPAERLWVNPDCGLKTRAWDETKIALATLVKMAQEVRHELTTH